MQLEKLADLRNIFFKLFPDKLIYPKEKKKKIRLSF